MLQKLNCKIYHGPYVYNFEEIYKILEKIIFQKKLKIINELSKNLIKRFKKIKKKIKNLKIIK